MGFSDYLIIGFVLGVLLVLGIIALLRDNKVVRAQKASGERIYEGEGYQVVITPTSEPDYYDISWLEVETGEADTFGMYNLVEAEAFALTLTTPTPPIRPRPLAVFTLDDNTSEVHRTQDKHYFKVTWWNVYNADIVGEVYVRGYKEARFTAENILTKF